jgi:hypothetical protein
MVVRVDASLATFAEAVENCSQATTTVNPSRAP